MKVGMQDERRRCVRKDVGWSAALVRKSGLESALFHGPIHDISLCGAGLYAETDIFTEQALVLLLSTPLAFGRGGKSITTIDCDMRQSIYVPALEKFHIGLQFTRFHDIGKHVLAQALSAGLATGQGSSRQFSE